MATYNEESLEQLNKKSLVSIILSLQDKLDTVNDKLVEEFKQLKDKIDADLAVTKQVNDLLVTRVTNLEHQCWANAQYSRRECLEIVGIPSSVSHEDLENKVIDIFSKVGCNVANENIEACHRINQKSDRTIVKLSRRKDCLQMLSVKKDLQNLDMDELDLPAGTKIFINQSLCPYYKVLWSKSKRLRDLEKIHSFYISNNGIKIRIRESSKPIIITHVADLEKHFPGIDLSLPH